MALAGDNFFHAQSLFSRMRKKVSHMNLVSHPMNCLVRLIDYIELAIFEALTL